mgnify:CR=1 FL=1
MTKITLQDIESLTNESSAITRLNANYAEIESKSDTFVSRDGTTPNTMTADLDMNSKRILNLPVPVADTEPLRKIDVPSAASIVDINTSVANAGSSATASASSATASATSATNAANSAAQLIGTSTSSHDLGSGIGSKAFTTQAGKFFAAGTQLLITSDSAPSTKYMHGISTAYSGTSLTVDVSTIVGTGTLTDWTIRVSGIKGAAGSTGPTGPTGPAPS